MAILNLETSRSENPNEVPHVPLGSGYSLHQDVLFKRAWIQMLTWSFLT
jgi:hypothetical protein